MRRRERVDARKRALDVLHEPRAGRRGCLTPRRGSRGTSRRACLAVAAGHGERPPAPMRGRPDIVHAKNVECLLFVGMKHRSGKRPSITGRFERPTSIGLHASKNKRVGC